MPTSPDRPAGPRPPGGRLRRLGAVLAVAAALVCAAGRAGLADTLQIETGTGTHTVHVEIAADEDSRERGLMYRRSLAPDAGMLFEFDEDQPVAMWMKNTYIPLDMVFLSADGRVVNIVRDATPLSLDILRSDGPVRATLELPAGAADRLGIAPGARVRHPFFAPRKADAGP